MEEINPREKNFVVFKVSGALLFNVFGIMGFFFSVWKGNWNSAGWCIVLEICCTLVLLFNKHHVKGELHLKYSARFFRIMKYFALALSVGGWGAFVAYIVVGTMQHETFAVKSNFAASPVAFMVGFWSFVLFFDCRKFEYLLE